MSRKGEVDQRKPSRSELRGCGMHLEDEPDDEGAQRGQEEKGVADSPVVGEITHRIAKGNQDIEIGNPAANRASHRSPVAHPPAQHGLAQRGSQSQLGQGIQGESPFAGCMVLLALNACELTGQDTSSSRGPIGRLYLSRLRVFRSAETHNNPALLPDDGPGTWTQG